MNYQFNGGNGSGTDGAGGGGGSLGGEGGSVINYGRGGQGFDGLGTPILSGSNFRKVGVIKIEAV